MLSIRHNPDGTVTLFAQIAVEKFLWQTDAGAEVVRQRQAAVARWVGEVAPPAEPRIAEQLASSRKVKLDWESACPETGSRLTAWRSGGLSQASVTIAADESLDNLSRAVGRATHQLLQAAHTHHEGFKPRPGRGND